MKPYLDLVQRVVMRGEVRQHERTGVSTYAKFGEHLRIDLRDGFPLLTTKALNVEAIVQELLFFIAGARNVSWLHERNVHIWDQWADESGDLGPLYGVQWRSWPDYDGGYIDQLGNVVRDLQRAPESRRHLVCAWNAAHVTEMALPPCHFAFQFYVDGVQRLHCQVHQRSADVFVGLPFNIASYALLTHIVASICHLEVGWLTFALGDTHLYRNHAEAWAIQRKREPRPLPTLRIVEPITSLDTLRREQIAIVGYDPHPALRVPVAK